VTFPYLAKLLILNNLRRHCTAIWEILFPLCVTRVDISEEDVPYLSARGLLGSLQSLNRTTENGGSIFANGLAIENGFTIYQQQFSRSDRVLMEETRWGA